MTDVAMESPSTTEMPSITELLAPGAAAVRRFWRPFLLLQGGAMLLVITYYASPAVQRGCLALSRWHDRGGLLFAAIAAAIAGGLLPEVAKWVLPSSQKKLARDDFHEEAINDVAAFQTSRMNDVTFAFFAFAVNGVITDLQYRGLGWVFGYDGSMSTTIKKMLADQFITTPIYGIVYWALVYRWRALNYSLPRLGREMSLSWYLQQVGPLLLPCWFFWIPMVTLVYSMPKALQFELFCLALAAWSLLMVFIATRVEETALEGGR